MISSSIMFKLRWQHWPLNSFFKSFQRISKFSMMDLQKVHHTQHIVTSSQKCTHKIFSVLMLGMLSMRKCEAGSLSSFGFIGCNEGNCWEKVCVFFFWVRTTRCTSFYKTENCSGPKPFSLTICQVRFQSVLGIDVYRHNVQSFELG